VFAGALRVEKLRAAALAAAVPLVYNARLTARILRSRSLFEK
jgi:hypothetical protein